MNLRGHTKKYSVERMFVELEKLQIKKMDEGAFEELERTKKQKNTLLTMHFGGKIREFTLYSQRDVCLMGIINSF